MKTLSVLHALGPNTSC